MNSLTSSSFSSSLTVQYVNPADNSSDENVSEDFGSFFKIDPENKITAITHAVIEEKQKVWETFTTPQECFQGLKAFEMFLDKEVNCLRTETQFDWCWNYLNQTQEALLRSLEKIFNDISLNHLFDPEEEHYLSFLKRFIVRLAICTYQLHSYAREQNYYMNARPEKHLFINGFPSLSQTPTSEQMDVDTEIPAYISPFVILLSLTKEQLSGKNLSQTIAQFLEPYTNQLIQDINANPRLIELFNSGFAQLRELRTAMIYMYQSISDQDYRFSNPKNEQDFVNEISDILKELINSCHQPSVHSILVHYRCSFHYYNMSLLCSPENKKALESLFLDLGYEIYVSNIFSESPKHSSTPFTSVKVIWKEGLHNIKHESTYDEQGGDTLIVNLPKQKINDVRLGEWIYELTSEINSVQSIQFPYDLLFNTSGVKKRKRDDETIETIVSFNEKFDDFPSCKVQIVGDPKQIWNQSLLTKVRGGNLKYVKYLEVPIGCIYSSTMEIPAKVVNEALKGKWKFSVSFNHFIENEETLNKLLDYLNSLDCKEIVLTIDGDANSELLIKFLKSIKHNLKCHVLNTQCSDKIDLLSLLTEFSTKVPIKSSKSTVNILFPLLLSNPQHSQAVQLLNSFLENGELHEVLQETVIEKIESSLTFPEMEALLAVIAKNKRVLVLYNQFAKKVLKTAYQKYNRISFPQHPQSHFEECVIYMLYKRILSSKELNDMHVSSQFLAWLARSVSLQKSPEEAKIIANQLKPLVDQLLQALIADDLDDNKECISKFVSFFLKQGWFPAYEEGIFKSQTVQHLLIPVLSQSVPHLNESKQKWVERICEFFRKEHLEEQTQFDFVNLIKYHIFQKGNRFVILPLDGFLETNLITLKKFFDLCLENPGPIYLQESPQIAVNQLFEYIVFLTMNSDLETETIVQYSIDALTILDNIFVLNNSEIGIVDIINEFFRKCSSFSNYQEIIERILKEIVIVFKSPYETKNLRISAYVASYLLNSGLQLNENIIRLCARAHINSAWGMPQTEIHSGKRTVYQHFLWEEIKEIDDDLKINIYTLSLLWRKLQDKHTSYTQNSNGEATAHNVEVKEVARPSRPGPGRGDGLVTLPQLYEQLHEEEHIDDLLSRGTVIFQRLLLQSPEAKIEDHQTERKTLLSQILEYQKIQIDFVKQILESVLISKKFRKNLKYCDIDTLTSILNNAPFKLNEQSQKTCFELFCGEKHLRIPSPQWVSQHPTFYNKGLNFYTKGDFKILSREDLISLLAIDCPGTDEQKFVAIIKRLNLEPQEFCYLYSRKPFIITHLGRALTEWEKIAMKLIGYEAEDIAERIHRLILQQNANQAPTLLIDRILTYYNQCKFNSINNSLKNSSHPHDEKIYIVATVTEKLKIFQKTSCPPFDSSKVSSEAKDKCNFMISRSRFIFNSPITIVRFVYGYMNKDCKQEDIIEWFRNNLPDGINSDQLNTILFDNNNKIKIEMLIYFLEKSYVLKKL